MVPGIKQDDSPLVSIALCAYNGEKFLAAQIVSILEQSYSNFELIIVDDVSTDSTLEIIKQFAAKDPRVKYFINTSNLGYNKNFEKAFGLCQAAFIAISDQDDIWDKTKIRTMMENWPEDAVMAYCLSRDFYGDIPVIYKKKSGIRHSDLDDARKIVFSSDVVGHTIIFKKALLDHCLPFPGDIYYDWWLCMHAVSISYIACIPHFLIWHRIHEHNHSRKLGLIKDIKEKQRLLRHQNAHLIETFYANTAVQNKEKLSLLTYASLLRKMDGRHFNLQMFLYVMKNRKWIFHYKKKPFVSHIKHAFKMGFKGILRYCFSLLPLTILC